MRSREYLFLILFKVSLTLLLAVNRKKLISIIRYSIIRVLSDFDGVTV